MKLLKRIFVIVVVLALIIIIGGYGLYTYQNRRPSPDYYEVYKNQDTKPVGKVGVFVTGLIMPPNHEEIFWYNITHIIFNTHTNNIKYAHT